MTELSKFEIDAIAEIINIGAGHASNALSVMTRKDIHMSFPEVKLCPIEKIPQLLGNPEDLVAAVYLKIEGKSNNKLIPVGSLIFMLQHDSAEELAALLENRKPPKEKSFELGEMDVSALEETGNILSGASLTAISKVLDMQLVESLPHFAHDMLQAVLSFCLIELAPKATDALTFTTAFEVEGHEIDAYFLLLLDPESLELLSKRLRTLFEDMLAEYIEEEYSDA
ncbi:MAG: chemotaxis protein CheC [Candidatus Altiarchaeota archaeon]|nr:chemotaxis protein CheC [Candidatus Altiarchaeota archaeon]